MVKIPCDDCEHRKSVRGVMTCAEQLRPDERFTSPPRFGCVSFEERTLEPSEAAGMPAKGPFYLVRDVRVDEKQTWSPEAPGGYAVMIPRAGHKSLPVTFRFGEERAREFCDRLNAAVRSWLQERGTDE